MNLKNTVTLSFVLSFLLSLVGAYLKIIHAENADSFLILGLIATLVFISTAIYEVRTSNRIDHAEKTMWTIAFIFMGGITGLIYFVIGRKRIASNH